MQGTRRHERPTRPAATKQERPPAAEEPGAASNAVRRLAGALLVVVPLAFTVCFTLLASLFEYPDILRQPTADVLTKFRDGGAPLVAVWYALTLTALAFVPLTVLVHRALAPRDTSL